MLIFTCFVLISLSWCSTQQPRAKTTSARFAVAPWDVGAPLSIRTRCRRQPRQSLQNKNIAWKNEKTRVIRCHTEDWILSQSVKRIQNQNDSCNVSSVRRESCGLSHGLPYLRSSLFRLSLLTSSNAVTSACVDTLWGGVEMAQKEAHQRQGLRHTRHLRHRVRLSNQDDFRTSKQACQLVQCGNASMHHLDKSHSTEEQMKSWPPLYVKSKWAAWDWPLANRQWNTRRASQLQWNGSPKRHRNRSCVWRSWWSERCEKKKEGHNVLFGAFSERKSIDVYSI